MISIIVPYRDRAEHLKLFLERMKTIKQEKEILIVEQVDHRPFNRGKLLNIGATMATGDHFIFHDVDLLPGFFVYPILSGEGVVQLAKSNIQTVGYLGGVTIFDKTTFYRADGYSNNFFSRAEDNEMMFNLNRRGINVVNIFLPFEELPHKRPAVEFDETLWRKAQMQRIEDGVSNLGFELIETVIARDLGSTTFRVSL